MSESLVFDGKNLDLPCFFHPPSPYDALEHPFDPKTIPDNYLMSPTDFPQNDARAIAQAQSLSQKLPASQLAEIPPDACTTNPDGFVCGPLPAHNGQLVKCVPRMNHSDLNQLSARVLPYSVNRANGSLDNPDRGDPRFYVFPESYNAAMSRCCNGKISDPVDFRPTQCLPSREAEKTVADRIHAEQHKVYPMELCFRKRPEQLDQLRLTNSVQRSKHISANKFASARDALWKLESMNIKVRSVAISECLVIDRTRFNLRNFL
jgi:hypothetical protein